MLITAAIVVFCLGAALYLFFVALPRMSASERDLLLRCHGSKEQKERLIALEQRRDPSRSRSQAIAAALYSLRRDKR
jgi:hypothetical protein